MGAEKRSLHRINNKYGSELSARISFYTKSVPGTILDFNALGVAIQINGDFTAREGDYIEKVEIHYGNECLSSVAGPKIVRANPNDRIYVFSLTETFKEKNHERLPRTALKTVMQGIVWGTDPLTIDQMLYFKVVDFSPQGFRLSSSKSNRHLLTGMVFRDFSLQIPGHEVHIIHFQISNVNESENGISFGCRLISVDKKLENLIRKLQVFLVKSEDRDPNLNPAIKTFKKFNSHLQIATAITGQDYQDVLKIRFKAYKAANKVKSDQTIEHMADKYDRHSIIYIARFGVNIIGTMRLVMREEGTTLPFEEYIDITQVKNIDTRSCAEVSRLAVDPDFQGTDVFLALFRKIIYEIGVKKIESPVCLATQKLLPSYKSIGAYEAFEPIPHPTIATETLTLLMFDRERVRTGKMSSLGWFFVVRPALDLMRRHQFIQRPPMRIIHFFRLGFELLFMKLKRLKKTLLR